MFLKYPYYIGNFYVFVNNEYYTEIYCYVDIGEGFIQRIIDLKAYIERGQGLSEPISEYNIKSFVYVNGVNPSLISLF